MVNSPRPGGPGWLRADPGQLERFADELDSLVTVLERILAKEEDAAAFRGPSTDPATLRAQSSLAADAHAAPDTPVRSVQLAIDDLKKQAEVARLAARGYRAHEDEAAETFRRIEERP